MAESKRAARLHEKKDQSTATQAVDRKTRLLLFKMLESGMLEAVNGVISAGMWQQWRIDVPSKVLLTSSRAIIHTLIFSLF